MKNQEHKIQLSNLVDQMMAEQNHNPLDYCFRYVIDRYPKAVHDAFDFPGEYADNLKVEVFTDDGRNLKMDYAQLVMPKGDITCKSTINMEHQTYPINEKVSTIYDYKLFLIHQTNIPSNSIVMTNMDIGQDYSYCKSHDQVFKLHVNLVTPEKISKRITILKDIIENNKKMPQMEAMYFAYISIFVKDEYSKETMEKITQLFSQINQIEPELELDIHQILKKMIKEHFKDDKIKCKELLTRISKSIFQKNLEGLTYKEKTEIRMNDLNQQIEKQGHQLEQKNYENKKLKKEIEQLKKQISKQE